MLLSHTLEKKCTFLQQKMYPLKYENGHIFVRHNSTLSVEPTRKPSTVIEFPPKKGKITAEKELEEQAKRKTSVLESPFRLWNTRFCEDVITIVIKIILMFLQQ